jgi:hypothetical protein
MSLEPILAYRGVVSMVGAAVVVVDGLLATSVLPYPEVQLSYVAVAT